MHRGDLIAARAIEEGEYIVVLGATVREIAHAFGVSKSTVHKDVTERLARLRPRLAADVRKVLDLHANVRHLRGGQATRLKHKGAVV